MISSYVVLLMCLSLALAQVTIKQIYFDPTTSITRERRDGVVIIESSNGKKSTICNDDFTNDDAAVICRMMGYSNGEDAFALISSKSSYKQSPIFYSNFSCAGNESSLENCMAFEYKLADQSCQNHEKDVHVYCNNRRKFSKLFVNDKNATCDRDVAEIKHGNTRMGLMFLKSGNESFTLCGRNHNFGENEAHLLCKLLCFQNVRFARIISNYEVQGAPIGGFRNMKCSPNAESLNDCSNVYSDDSEMCTPSDNIGVACESQPPSLEPKPKIICNGDKMTLEWDNKIFPDIEAENVNILNGVDNCSTVEKRTADGILLLTVKLDKCKPTITGTKDNLVFRHKVQRIFPKKNQLVVRNTQNFDATCLIARKEVVGDASVNLHTNFLNPAGNSVKFETKLELSTTFDFSNILTMPYSQKIGTILFARISLLSAPNQIQLVLQKCFLYNSANDIEVLIDDKCAVRPTVKINPVSDHLIKFNYRSFAIRGENLPLFIKCETSKCGKSEVGCSSSCQKP